MATALRFRPLDAFYNVLNPVPFGFFVAALVFDATYFATAEVMWGKSAAWLISLGLRSPSCPASSTCAAYGCCGARQSSRRPGFPPC